MENKRIIKFGVLLIATGILSGIPVLVRAYEPETTHKAITQGIVLLFNNYNSGLALNDSDRALVVRGSFDEDAGMSALHHFYDQVNNKVITIVG